MSVLIKGFKMPNTCDDCEFSDWSNFFQTACCSLRDYDACFDKFSNEYRTKRSDICPLVDVPTPHGRLVDADNIYTSLDGYLDFTEKEAPTIIEAESEADSDEP